MGVRLRCVGPIGVQHVYLCSFVNADAGGGAVVNDCTVLPCPRISQDDVVAFAQVEDVERYLTAKRFKSQGQSGFTPVVEHFPTGKFS